MPKKVTGKQASQKAASTFSRLFNVQKGLVQILENNDVEMIQDIFGESATKILDLHQNR